MKIENEIDPKTSVGTVALSVAKLTRSLIFYEERIGLTVQERGDDSATLGTEKGTLLRLQEVPGAQQAGRATGLFHFALRVPSRLELARTIARLVETKTPIDGASDHHVSEAIYLNDPDGHGIEIYRDRPRSSWVDGDGNFLMNTTPFDASGVMGELEADAPPWHGIHPETEMGHIHLRVADLQSAEEFYVNVMGFQVMAQIESALFVSAGGYHHHIGMNTWAGVGIPAPPENAARLLHYEICLPDDAALDALLARLTAAEFKPTQRDDGWLVQDPSQIGILFRTA
jgi:catechol 2,3-dioxygenase